MVQLRHIVLTIVAVLPCILTDNKCILHPDSFESQFCALKDVVTAMETKYSDLTQAETDIANLKHTVQSQTARILDNENAIASQLNTKNVTDQNDSVREKVDQLQQMVADLLNRTASLEDKVTGPVKPCDSNPCQNNASCLEMTGGYYCACKANFTGTHCEKEDHCSITPCQNGGTCFSNAISYICNCTVGYNGPTCDNKLNPCDSNPCVNGLCTYHNDTYTCSCDVGFTGVNCDVSTSATSGPVVASSTSALPITSTTTLATPQPTTPSVCDGAPKCNPPATCTPIPHSNDYKCVCPETPETQADACWEPSYLEPFGFCCMVNTCVVPPPDPKC